MTSLLSRVGTVCPRFFQLYYTNMKYETCRRQEPNVQHSLFDGLSSNVGFRFWFNPSEYFHPKGFIPLSRMPSFFEKWQVVIKFLYLLNKCNFKLILQPTVLTTLLQEYSVGLSFYGGTRKRRKKCQLIRHQFLVQCIPSPCRP